MRALSSAICHFAVRNTMNTRRLKRVTHRFAFELSTLTCGGRPSDGTTVIGRDWTGTSARAGPAKASRKITPGTAHRRTIVDHRTTGLTPAREPVARHRMRREVRC